MHQLLQGFRIDDVAWLRAGPPTSRTPQSERNKRRELVEELVFWVFESCIVPLLRVSWLADSPYGGH